MGALRRSRRIRERGQSVSRPLRRSRRTLERGQAQRKCPSLLSKTAKRITRIANYCYTGLDQSDSSTVRILELLPSRDSIAPLRGQLHISKLHRSQCKYEALSYAWGSEAKPDSIELDGKRLRIGENLGLALRRLRGKTTSRRLWVDAICIHQGDDQERTHQVRMVTSIYSHAKRTIAWRGEDPIGDGQHVFSLCRWAISIRATRISWKYTPYSWNPRGTLVAGPRDFVKDYEFEYPAKWSLLQAFIERDYFSRRWVVQELIVARDVQFICGSSHMRAEALAYTMSILEMQTWQGPSRLMAIDYQRGFERSSDPKHLTYEGHFMQLMNVVAAAGLTRARRIKSSWHQESKSWNKKIAMFDILERLHELQCRDDRDRIAAFGWLIDPTWDFAVDYANTVEQVYYQFATRVVERGHFPSTVARMLVSAALRSWQWEEGRLPGWIPDWRVTPMQSDLTSERPKPRPATSNYHKRDLGTALSIYLPGRSSRVECKILEGRVLQLRCIQFTHYVTFVTNAVMDEGFVVRFELGCDVLFSRYDGRANTHKLVTAPTGLPETPYNLGPRGDTIDLTILIV